MLSVLISITVPSFFNMNKMLEGHYFFKQLERDLNEAQMRAISEGSSIRVIFSHTQNQYSVRRGVETIKTRTLPKGMTVNPGSLPLNGIQYRTDGTLMRTGTLNFVYRGDFYELKFHFIRGRFTIEKL
nr:hypothetical protein [Bacillus shivajii]